MDISQKTVEEVVEDCSYYQAKHGEEKACIHCPNSTLDNDCPFGEHPIDWEHITLNTENALEVE